MSRRRRTLYAVTVAVMAALLALPVTRWLVRAQVFPALGMPNEVMAQLGLKTPAHLPQWTRAEPWSGSVRRLAAAVPDDFPVQLAAAWYQEDARRRERLRALCETFPDEPAAHAALLRYATGYSEADVVKVGHTEEQNALLPQRPAQPDAPRPEPERPVSAERLAEFDRAAAAGERLDPENAYFPAMRAVGYLAAKQDAEALAALKRAGACGTWNEYLTEEIEGRWRLANAAYRGETGSLSRIAIAFATLFPHYAQLRAAARVATAKAVAAEQAGDVAEGIAIRKAVARLGGLMRSDSTSAIGSLVGKAITGIAALRPGGAPALANANGDSEARAARARQVEEAYVAFLTANGEAAEAQWFRSEMAAGDRMRGLIKKASARTFLLTPELESVLALRGVGQALLANATVLGVFGVVYLVLMRLSPSLREGRPLDAATKWGGALLVLLPASVAGVSLLISSNAPYLNVVGAVLATGLLLVAPVLRSRMGVRGVLRGAATAGVLALTGVIAAACVAVQVVHSVWPLQVFDGLSGFGANGTNYLLITLGAIGLCGAVPLLLHGVLAILARPLRLPVSHVIARGVTALAGPLACALLLAYGAVTVATVRAEAVAIRALKRMVTHEGRHMAASVGEEWPGATPQR